MEALRTVLIVIFLVDSLLLILAILLQSGRGGGLAGALGGISSDSALGVRAASQIEKATAWLAAIFFITTLGMATIIVVQGRSQDEPEIAPKPAASGVELAPTTPVTPETPAVETETTAPAAEPTTTTPAEEEIAPPAEGEGQTEPGAAPAEETAVEPAPEPAPIEGE